jgi:predicted MPP superfamily phosphohydrolase
MLINEHATLEIGVDVIRLTGIDDAHAFYTDAAVRAIQDRETGFRILLAHTPEVADLAAAAGCDLYLTGHTHGGQICLPNGRPLAAGLDRNRELASGYWRIGAMQGYTNRGLGVASLPLRINCPAEIAVLRLLSVAE